MIANLAPALCNALNAQTPSGSALFDVCDLYSIYSDPATFPTLGASVLPSTVLRRVCNHFIAALASSSVGPPAAAKKGTVSVPSAVPTSDNACSASGTELTGMSAWILGRLLQYAAQLGSSMTPLSGVSAVKEAHIKDSERAFRSITRLIGRRTSMDFGFQSFDGPDEQQQQSGLQSDSKDPLADYELGYAVRCWTHSIMLMLHSMNLPFTLRLDCVRLCVCAQ